MNSHFELTSKRPDLDITAVNPTGKRWRDTDGIEVEIGLFYRLHDDPSDSWKAVPNTITLTRILRSRDSPASAFAEKEADFGRATLWVSADDNDLFQSGRRYEFQLRSQCYKKTLVVTIVRLEKLAQGLVSVWLILRDRESCRGKPLSFWINQPSAFPYAA